MSVETTFSPLVLPALIMEPLKYYFSNYGGSASLVWNDDPKERTIDIDHFNNFIKVPLEERPRILVDRGDFTISPVGLSNSLAESKSVAELKGLRDSVQMSLYQGTAQIVVEARNMGTCEVVSDMAFHFISWSRELLCNSQGFKMFGQNMTVSQCRLVEKENTEKFQIVIQIPWIKEELWRIRNDAVLLKAIQNVLTLKA